MGAGPHIDMFMLIGVAVVVAVAAALWLGKDALIARRVYARFVFVIALPLLLIFGLPLWLLSLVTNFDAKIWQGVIAGSVIAAGWLTTAIFAEFGKARDKDERTRDYHKAIYAEIGNFVQNLSANDGGETLRRMANDKHFVPFVPREHNDQVFNAIVGNIEVLPRQSVDAIVAYYSLIKAISTLADDMRGDRFRELEPDRRQAIYSDYLDMRRQARAFGEHALALIRAFSENGTAGADAVLERVSSRGAALSDQSRGSE